MKKTLYVTDLDGTLMRNDKSISDASIEIFNSLIEDGVSITYATARSIRSASVITEGIHFELPVITRNGTVFADSRTGRELEIATFQPEELALIRNYINGLEIPGFVTTYIDGCEKKRYLAGRENEGFRYYLADHATDQRLQAVNTEEEMYEGEVCYFTFIADKEELDPLFLRVGKGERWNCVYQRDTYRPEYWLELCPKAATKANAIRKLQKTCGCERLVVFGDTMNDASMFRIADEAYAVGNADEGLKEIATGVLGTNQSDSVARWLRQYTQGK